MSKKYGKKLQVKKLVWLAKTEIMWPPGYNLISHQEITRNTAESRDFFELSDLFDLLSQLQLSYIACDLLMANCN